MACFGNGGATVANRFMFNFTYESPVAAPSYGYAWANAATSRSDNPSADYQAIAVNRGDGTRAGVTDKVLIQRYGVGVYHVIFEELAGLAEGLHGASHVKVNAYGTGADYCNVRSMSTYSDDRGRANVRCYDGNGNPKDTTFTSAYSSTVSR